MKGEPKRENRLCV